MTRKLTTKSLVKAIRQVPSTGGWHELPDTGFTVHRLSLESCKQFGWNEVWARTGERGTASFQEYRGSAETVAEMISVFIKAQPEPVKKGPDMVSAELQALLA